MKKILLIWLVIVAAVAQGQTPLFRLDARGLSNALAASDYVLIDKNVAIDSAMEIPVGKVVTITNGAVISASEELTIQGQIIAPLKRIFADDAEVKFGQYAAHDIYPEWFGARAMVDIRDTSVAGSTIDNIEAFEAVVNCVEGIHYADGKHTVNNVIISGFYGFTRKLSITEKQVNFIGRSRAFNGTGFKFIGTLTGDSAQKYLLEYSGANFSRMENIAIKGKRTTNDALRMIAAVHFIAKSGGTPQRELSFTNISIGDGIGNWSDGTSGYEFENGFACGLEGVGQNNDFFKFDDIKIANCRVGIKNSMNMAVNWIIDGYNFEYGETMVSYPEGGTFTGREWYAATNTYGYIIRGGTDNTRILRFEIYNFDSEHSQGDGLVWSDGTVRGKFTNGHINSDGLSASDGAFRLLGGNACIYNPILTFDQCSFLFEGTQPSIFDCSVASGSRGYFKFEGCSAVEGIAFKLPSAASRATYFINVDGRNIIDDDDTQMFLNCALNNSNPDINPGTNLVYMSALLASGVNDMPYRNISVGKRGYQILKGQYTDTRSAFSAAANTQTFNYQLPANVNIKSVTVAFYESGVLASGGYVKVGYSGNDEAFGRITGTTAGVMNSKPFPSGLTFTSATSLVLKSFNSSDVATSMTGSKLVILCVEYEKMEGVTEISVNAIADMPFDGAE